jgi:hypothetical protein
LRRFDLGGRGPARRLPWAASVTLHVLVVVLGITVVWHAPFRTGPRRVPEVYEWVVLPSLGATRESRPAAVSTSRRRVLAAEPVIEAPLEAPLAVPVGAPAPGGGRGETALVPGPQVGDGRLWVSPRPALPAELAARVYGDTAAGEPVAEARLRVMLDSFNLLVDAEQRSRRRPSWVGEVGGLPIGIDSQYIHIAGLKVPAAMLAMLGSLLPQGNYDGALRARQMQDMRDDMLRAAQRAETFRDFQRYVKELRARKQAERDADRARAVPPDTTRVIP